MIRKESTLSLTQLLWDGYTSSSNINRVTSEAESARFQLLVDAENMAHSVMRTRTGMLSNPMERAASLTDIVAPSRSKPIPVRLVPQAPAKLPFPTPKKLPLLHKDSRSETQSMI